MGDNSLTEKERADIALKGLGLKCSSEEFGEEVTKSLLVLLGEGFDELDGYIKENTNPGDAETLLKTTEACCQHFAPHVRDTLSSFKTYLNVSVFRVPGSLLEGPPPQESPSQDDVEAEAKAKVDELIKIWQKVAEARAQNHNLDLQLEACRERSRRAKDLLTEVEQFSQATPHSSELVTLMERVRSQLAEVRSAAETSSVPASSAAVTTH